MNNWIFVVTSHRDHQLSGEDIFKQRTQDRFWGLGESTPNRRALAEGDEAVFYIGTPAKNFAGTARLASDSFKLTPEQQEQYSHGRAFYKTEYGVLLKDIRTWDVPRPVEPLVPLLDFIENKAFWGTYFQGGVREVSSNDFSTITVQSGRSQTTTDEIESESEFALESHLEEFLDKNWERIDFGAPLERYRVDDQDGRQFPAGPWSIDFLCRDKSSGDFVVVELKRGKTSDATVGQVLRYIGWVAQNLAKGSCCVRGLIIAREVDEALRYAVASLPSVSILTYRVQFKLTPDVLLGRNS
jgi:hypothetical protein